MNPIISKQEIRKSIRQQINGLNRDIRTEWDVRTTRMVLESPIWQKAETILLFASLPDEIDTSRLIEDAVSAEKRIILPVVRDSDLELFVYHPGQIAPGAFGIMEPTSNASPLSDFSAIDLAIVPGIAFTRKGDRLGRGKGFYDRLLPLLPCPCYGLGYTLQILHSLPTDPWDVSLDGIFAL